MKIVTRKVDVAVTGMQNQRAFTVKAGAHIMSVLSGLYSDPVDAMVREYMTNMYDAYVALRKKNPNVKIIPPVISLPTTLDSTLSFTDYGVGMSLEQVWNVYATYGETTKGGDNTEVGGFGLGSKTAFCYNEGASWMIESRYDGVKNIFTAFIGEDSVPNLTHVSSEPTTEHSGMTISIPINRTDVQDAVDAYLKYAPYFPMELIAKGVAKPAQPIDYIVRGSHYGFHRKAGYGNNGGQVIMGNVPYPVDYHSWTVKHESDDANDIIRFIRNNKIDLFLEIGEVDIVPSRDSLKYTPRTMDALERNIRKMIANLPIELGKQLDDCDTEWEAVEKARMISSISAEKIVKSIVWRGKKINASCVERTLDGLRKIDPAATVAQYAITDGSTARIAMTEPAIFGLGSDDNKPTWCIVDDMPNGGANIARGVVHARCVSKNHNGRARRYGHTPGHALLIRTTATAAQLSDFFGGMPVDKVQYVSVLKGTVAVPQSVKVRKDTIYRWSGSSWQARVHVPKGTDTYYYLPLEKDGARYGYVSERWNQKRAMERMTILANQLGMNVTVIYGMKKDDTPNLSANWKNLENEIVAESIRRATETVETQALASMPHNHEAEGLLDILEQAELSTVSPVVSQFVGDMQKIRNARNASESAVVSDACQCLAEVRTARETLLKSVKVPDVEGQVKKIFEAYPMLKVVHAVSQRTYGYRENPVGSHKKLLLDYCKAM